LARTRVSTAISRDGGRVWEFFQNLISYNEVTRVEPGPIHLVRPEETYMPAGQPPLPRDASYISSDDVNYRASYPSCLVLEDRVIVTHTFTEYLEHPTQATMTHHKMTGGPNQH